MKIAVLGAGVIGITTAYYLHKLGYEVTVIERNSESASECSHANGGQLSYSHAEPWANPTALRKIPKWLICKDSPLVFAPRLDLPMWRWAISFLMHCNKNTCKNTTTHTLRLALHSRDCFAAAIKDTAIDFSYLEKGTVHVFRNEQALEANIAQAEFQKTMGCDYEVLNSRKDCEAKEPALKYSPANIIGGIYFPMDATGDVHKFTENLSLWLKDRGVTFLYGESVKAIDSNSTEITGFVTDTGVITADKYVIASGAPSPKLLQKIGINVPIYPMKGYSLSIEVKDESKAPISGVTDQYNKIVYSRLGNILRVAGTAEFAGYNDHTVPARLDTLRRMTKQLFPESGDINAASEWACLRPSTPEGTPIIGRTKYNNFYLNIGHGTLGWTLSCGSASILTNIIHNNSDEIDLTGLTLAKY